MVGISSYGVYLPLNRLDFRSVGEGTQRERAIASFDEDTLTMGVAAGINCLKGIDRATVDGLFFASSTFPYKEKQVSAIAAAALDLREDILTADFANSLRAGTIALKAALDSVKADTGDKMLVIASDMRLARPGSDLEKEFGNGAVAYLVDKHGKIALAGYRCVTDEIFDVWRAEDDNFVRTWEERFTAEEGYFRVLPKAVSALLEKEGLSKQSISKVAFNGLGERRYREMGTKLGFTADQIQLSVFSSLGDTGVPSSMMLFAACLEEAKPKEKLLLATYGSGADAFLFEVNEPITVKPSVRECIASKSVLKDYKKYLDWRGILEIQSGRRRPPTLSPSVTCLWREVETNIRLHGVRCKNCGTVQYPPQRVCYKCHGLDNFESYSFSDKKGRLFTYASDYATPTPDPPLIIAIVDFDGGGRIWAYVTDKKEEEISVGIPLEMTFRKLFTIDGIHNYSWKCMPIRFSK